jgi:flagellin-specific chaperone FliS
MSYPAMPHATTARPAARPFAPRPAASLSASAPRGGYGGGYGGAAQSQAARYREAELASATPGQLVVMLFDKMLLTLRRARVALEAGNVEERTGHVLAAMDMVTELQCSLDHETGGEIAANLDELPAGKKIDVVLRIATELREAFAGAQQQLAAAPAARSA